MGKKQRDEKRARIELPPISSQLLLELAQEEVEVRQRRAGRMAMVGALLFVISAAVFLLFPSQSCTTSDRTEITRAVDASDDAKSRATEVTVDQRGCQPTFPYLPVTLAVLGGVLIAPLVIGLLPGETNIEAFGAKLSHNERPSLSSISQENLESLERKLRERGPG